MANSTNLVWCKIGRTFNDFFPVFLLLSRFHKRENENSAILFVLCCSWRRSPVTVMMMNMRWWSERQWVLNVCTFYPIRINFSNEMSSMLRVRPKPKTKSLCSVQVAGSVVACVVLAAAVFLSLSFSQLIQTHTPRHVGGVTILHYTGLCGVACWIDMDAVQRIRCVRFIVSRHRMDLDLCVLSWRTRNTRKRTECGGIALRACSSFEMWRRRCA